MIRLYGEANGFGWKMDEIVGAQIVSVPLSASDEATGRTFTIVVSTLGAIALLVLGVGNLLIGRSGADKTN